MDAILHPTLPAAIFMAFVGAKRPRHSSILRIGAAESAPIEESIAHLIENRLLQARADRIDGPESPEILSGRVSSRLSSGLLDLKGASLNVCEDRRGIRRIA